jgi:hypothetical protein
MSTQRTPSAGPSSTATSLSLPKQVFASLSLSKERKNAELSPGFLLVFVVEILAVEIRETFQGWNVEISMSVFRSCDASEIMAVEILAVEIRETFQGWNVEISMSVFRSCDASEIMAVEIRETFQGWNVEISPSYVYPEQ